MDINMRNEVQSLLSQLRLFQLTSPTLPVGAFTYSQGIERAVEDGWLHSQTDTYEWLRSILHDSLCYLELPLMKRLYQAVESSSPTQFSYWSEYLLSSRETSELRQEERLRAKAFVEILNKLPQWSEFDDLSTYQEGLLYSQLAGHSLASYRWHITLEQTLTGYCWSWAENAVNAAIKLVPLGQSAGQSLLFHLSEDIPAVIASALLIEDEEIGASTPALAIASSLHETQYCRLFRS